MVHRTLAGFLCIALSAALATAAIADDKPSLKDFVQQAQGRHACGMFVDGKKVGWFIDELKLGRYGGREVAIASEEVAMELSLLGATNRYRLASTIVYELTGEGRIVYARDVESEDGAKTVRVVKPAGDELRITTRAGLRTSERRVAAPRDTLAGLRDFVHWMRSEPEAGATFERIAVDWSEADVNVAETYTFLKKETLRLAGVPTETYRLKGDIMGARFEEVVTGDGAILSGKLGPFDLRAGEEATIRQLDKVTLDHIYHVPVDKKLGDADKLALLTLHVTGVDAGELPSSARQQVRETKDGLEVTLTPDRPAAEAAPLAADARAKWLEATPKIQADHPRIGDLARRIVGDQSDSLEASRKLQAWVYGNLKKSYSSNASTALEVLDRRAGDCTEHSLLFVALARAAGIPARTVSGLMYGDEEQAFGWHEWAEAHDGRQWVSVDPTWDQVFVDPGHIRFSTGDDLSSLNAIGRVKLRVVEFRVGE